MSNFPCAYKGYTDLSWYELVAIVDYMKYNDSKALVSIIEHNDPSPGMRRFIADIAINKLTRPPNIKSSTFRRDYEIFKKIGSLLYKDPKLILTSSKDKAGAGHIVAESFGVKEGTAIKAYTNIKKVVEKSPHLETIKAVTKAYSIVREVLGKY